MAESSPEQPPADVIWRGRPQVGLRAPDLRAGAVTLLTAFVVLWPGLAAQHDWAWGWAARLAALYAGVLAAATTLGRASGVGWVVSVCTAFCAAVTVGALVTTQDGLALACPLGALGGLSWLQWLRFRQRRATRWELTRDRVRVGQEGRYEITFPLRGLPRVRTDVFGSSLGEVDFGDVEATLTTRDGRVFKVPAQRRRLQRVAHPERLLEALAKR